ncbi:MAG: hemolysin family protein [Opitutales bacterium]
MTALLLAIGFTIGVSALCSILEAMVLSTTGTEIESLKARHPRRGRLLETYRSDIEGTSSAILSLNTVANTLGATLVGGLASKIFGAGSQISLVYFPLGMTLGILIFSEIIPKNIGVLYRPALQPLLIIPLAGIRWIMWPASWLATHLMRLLTGGRRDEGETSDEDIIMMAEKSHADGEITEDERDMISGALSLDEVQVETIMTPRTVVTALERSQTIGEVFQDFRNLPFARLPVFDDTIDTIVGVVRRRDLLAAKADDLDDKQVEALMHDALFLPENASGMHALQTFLKNHQQLAIVVNEFGSVSGVVTMEDIIEHILGQEIFEEDDVAIDMRELARNRNAALARKKAALRGA